MQARLRVNRIVITRFLVGFENSMFLVQRSAEYVVHSESMSAPFATKRVHSLAFIRMLGLLELPFLNSPLLSSIEKNKFPVKTYEPESSIATEAWNVAL